MDMTGCGSYSPSLNFVPIPVSDPSFNIPSVDFSCIKITNPLSIWQKSFMCELLAICTDCRKIHSKGISRKKDWVYPEEHRQHVWPQRCVLETICFFVRWIVYLIFYRPARKKKDWTKETGIETTSRVAPSTPFPDVAPTTSGWTPRSDEVSVLTLLVTNVFEAYNTTMDTQA